MQTLKDDVRNKIIIAAVNEFYLVGYEKASMRNIARAAGISVSNTYNYYPAKQELFESIVEPVYKDVKGIFRKSMEHSLIDRAKNDNTLIFIHEIIDMLIKLNADQRRLLIILAEKSGGTKYMKAKEEMIGLIELHLAEAIRKTGSPSQIEDGQHYTLNIIAAHYIDGLLKILKDFRSQEWAAANIRTLLTYHFNGIKALM